MKPPILRLIVILLSAFMFNACAKDFLLESPAIEGQVLEVGTNKPIPGAIVVVLWKGHVGWSGTVCLHVETATSDDSGRYRIAPWQEPSRVGDVRAVRYPPMAYKPGYEYTDAKGETVYLKPFTGGRGERLQAIWSAGVQCGSAGASEKNLIPLDRALLDEAKALAQSKDDRKIVNALLYELEKRELGYEAATSRMLERKDQ